MDFGIWAKSYANNFPTALAFSLLLVFLLPFSWLSNAMVSSGTVMIGYGFLKEPILESLLLLVLALAFLFFYSTLICLMVLSVRRDLSHVKMNYYLSEKIHKFGYKYFRFLAIFTVIAAILAAILVEFSVPVLLINLALLVFSAVFLFLPQTIVVDEESLGASVLSNWAFIAKDPLSFIYVLFLGTLAVFLLAILEFAVDSVFPVGNYLSLIIALLVLVPLLEVVKTQIYMKRFSLIARYERHAMQ